MKLKERKYILLNKEIKSLIHSETNFIAPLNIPLVLAGTFGELNFK